MRYKCLFTSFLYVAATSHAFPTYNIYQELASSDFRSIRTALWVSTTLTAVTSAVTANWAWNFYKENAHDQAHLAYCAQKDVMPDLDAKKFNLRTYTLTYQTSTNGTIIEQRLEDDCTAEAIYSLQQSAFEGQALQYGMMFLAELGVLTYQAYTLIRSATAPLVAKEASIRFIFHFKGKE